MNPKKVKKLTDLALEPLRKIDAEADTLLMEVENLMIKHGMVKYWDDDSEIKKSEIRFAIEQFEKAIDNAWKQKCIEYKVGFDGEVPRVLDLPKEVYASVVDEYIRKPMVKILNALTYKTAKGEFRYVSNPRENPYVLAINALMKKWGHVLDKGKESKNENILPQ